MELAEFKKWRDTLTEDELGIAASVAATIMISETFDGHAQLFDLREAIVARVKREVEKGQRGEGSPRAEVQMTVRGVLSTAVMERRLGPGMDMNDLRVVGRRVTDELASMFEKAYAAGVREVATGESSFEEWYKGEQEGGVSG